VEERITDLSNKRVRGVRRGGRGKDCWQHFSARKNEQRPDCKNRGKRGVKKRRTMCAKSRAKKKGRRPRDGSKGGAFFGNFKTPWTWPSRQSTCARDQKNREKGVKKKQDQEPQPCRSSELRAKLSPKKNTESKSHSKLISSQLIKKKGVREKAGVQGRSVKSGAWARESGGKLDLWTRGSPGVGAKEKTVRRNGKPNS